MNSPSHRPLFVINVVGLTWDLIGPDTPNIGRLLDSGWGRPLQPVLPAVTCSVQASMLTGLLPTETGIVGNGWFTRELSEVQFWKQSNHLISGERIFDAAKQRDSTFTTAKMFWWYNMYSGAEYSVTPRPSYPADGRKIPDSYSEPESLRDELQENLGRFPLFNFWGPTADIKSTRWIADASVEVSQRFSPSLNLIYLPHLDYNLQRLGPNHPDIASDVKLVDVEVGKLLQEAERRNAEIIVLSEYGITETNRPIHINRVLREAGLLRTRREPLGWETLDCGASEAFAVADHQVAHVYVNDPARLEHTRQLVEGIPGVEHVYDSTTKASVGIDHARSGDLVVVSDARSWFTYYFWTDDRLAPDYARTVDIHRKPGYDPAELFVDPELKFPKLRIARRLAQKLLGFRYYMDVIGLDANIVKGSHGRLPDADKMESQAPVVICGNKQVERDSISATDLKSMMLQLQFGSA